MSLSFGFYHSKSIFHVNLNGELAELIGVFIGDGFIGRYGSHYHVEFTGNAEYEKDYYTFLGKIITKHFNVKPRFKTVRGAIRMIVTYKQLHRFFTDLGLIMG